MAVVDEGSRPYALTEGANRDEQKQSGRARRRASGKCKISDQRTGEHVSEYIGVCLLSWARGMHRLGAKKGYCEVNSEAFSIWIILHAWRWAFERM